MKLGDNSHNADLKIMKDFGYSHERFFTYQNISIRIRQDSFPIGKPQIRRVIDISALNSGWDGRGKKGALLLSLDLHKAFDSLSWDHLFFTLERYGFGSKFFTMLRTIYSEPHLIVEGQKSQSVPLIVYYGVGTIGYQNLGVIRIYRGFTVEIVSTSAPCSQMTYYYFFLPRSPYYPTYIWCYDNLLLLQACA